MPKKKNKLTEIMNTRKAPIVQCDRLELGDTRLDPDEMIKREHEDLLRIAGKKRLPKQEDLEDPDRAFGHRITHSDVIRRLQKEIPDLKAVPSLPGHVALYCPRTHAEYLEALVESDGHQKGFFLHHKYVGGFPCEPLPEFSTVDIDTSHLPTRENRGWRSVLIALLRAGVITYGACVRQFGHDDDVRAWRWREQTHPWRLHPETKFTIPLIEVI